MCCSNRSRLPINELITKGFWFIGQHTRFVLWDVQVSSWSAPDVHLNESYPIIQRHSIPADIWFRESALERFQMVRRNTNNHAADHRKSSRGIRLCEWRRLCVLLSPPSLLSVWGPPDETPEESSAAAPTREIRGVVPQGGNVSDTWLNIGGS